MEAGSHSKEFLWSEAVIESLFGLALFMVSAKLIGHTSYDIVPFAIGGGVYGFIGYVLLIMLFNLFGSSLYEADEIPERMDMLNISPGPPTARSGAHRSTDRDRRVAVHRKR